MKGFGEEYQEFRKILCLCPCCDEIVRVSDLRIFTKTPTPKTWLDDYEKQMNVLEQNVESFEEKEANIRKIQIEKGQLGAEKVIRKAISPILKELKINPYDMKPILNPIDFVVFDGMTKNGTVDEILLLSKNLKNSPLNAQREQLNQVVKEKKYDWQIARIAENGTIHFE
ncbi:MAG: Holliday junction resolvase-like protein [Candidatus Diapherotrites archaeon]